MSHMLFLQTTAHSFIMHKINIKFGEKKSWKKHNKHRAKYTKAINQKDSLWLFFVFVAKNGNEIFLVI